MDKKEALKRIKKKINGTMVSTLGIEVTDFGDEYICGKMPVDERTKQIYPL